ncbi:MAG TPA: PA14 domain-containing protein, partial [Oculatellaceae cyanobacterium]
LTEPRIPGIGSKEVYLKGTSTGLRTGDGLLFVGKERERDPDSEHWDFCIVKTVTVDLSAGYTKVTWEEGLGEQPTGKTLPVKETLKIYAFRQRASLFGHNAPDWLSMPDSIRRAYLGLGPDGSIPASANQWPDFNIPALGTRRGLYAEYFDGVDLNPNKRKVTRIDPNIEFNWKDGSPDPDIGADNFSVRWTGFVQPRSSGSYIFYTISDDGVRLWINGEQIIDNWTVHSETENSGEIELEAGQAYDIKLEYFEQTGLAKIELWWKTPNSPSNGNKKEIIPQSQFYPPHTPDIHLDSSYPQILPGSWLLLSIPDYQELYRVEKIAEDSKANFTLTTKTTRAALSGKNLSRFYNKLRETTIFTQSEQLEIVEAPLTDLLSGNVIELDSLVSGLEKGRLLIISGKRKTALVTSKAAGLELISEDGEKKTLLRPDDVLQVLEPPVKGEDKVLWRLIDRDGFKGSVTAPDGSILLEPAAPQGQAISEVAVLEGIFENALPKMLKVVEEAFKGDASKATAKGLKETGAGEAFEGGYYQVVGWNDESYVTLGRKLNKLVKPVLEQNANEERTVNEGEVWSMDGGWELAVQKIIMATGSDRTTDSKIKVQLALIKDGIKKDEKEVPEGNVYTYVEKSIAGETDVPLFVTFIDTIFSEAVLKAVSFKYTWAVGTNITLINIGNKFALPDETPGNRERTILVLEKAMQNSYDPFTAAINANIARATHGETIHEVLGSGNGAQANQHFTLKKQPVTYISAPTSSGSESTIEVRVNDVKWEEVPSLYGLDERIRGYIARTDEYNRSTLIFGDGKSGARIPTGQENVTATYRTGIGTEGMVRAGQLSLLMTRPLGV